MRGDLERTLVDNEELATINNELNIQLNHERGVHSEVPTHSQSMVLSLNPPHLQEFSAIEQQVDKLVGEIHLAKQLNEEGVSREENYKK